ncbi:hypothetical protein QVD99_006257 [Batrachochytrium dendrobatidis]|nr:hypothetical protein O5D80_003399 [Batrachochytrium dendrobatidis]KAK5667041.1 hypothetical protein QVD99_006257 [Batrachochytrium dendrobatidis]
MSVPSILVFPPLEEAYSEPCLSYSPDEAIKPLLNPTLSIPISAMNSLIQLFTSLPELNQELPVNSPDVAIAKFSAMAQTLHLRHDIKLSPSDILSALYWLQECLDITLNSAPANFEQVARSFLDCVLLKTRFGRRFDHRITDHQPIASEIPLENPVSSIPHKPTNSILTLDITSHSQSATVSLLTLLNTHFGRSPPSLFFGGDPSKFHGANRNIDDFSMLPTKKHFQLLPYFLLISFNRAVLDTTPNPATAISNGQTDFILNKPYNESTNASKYSHLGGTCTPTDSGTPKYHATSIELPLELDLGFYLDPNAEMPAHAGFRQDSRIPTFYRLHGFVTQLQAHFMTYTRLRGGTLWFKCDDEVVGSVDLGARVASKGVMVALYRMQDQ